MRLGEFDRWAGDLKANLARLLAARLSARLGTERIFLRPWASYRRPARQVRIDLTRLDGSPGGKATMQGTWTLLDGDGRSQLRLEAFDLHEPVRGSGYLGLVAAYSRLGDRLADHIAERLAGKATR
jgi:hypothetical protein